MSDMIPAWVDGKLQPVEKLEVHKRGLRHKAVSVFVMYGTKTLIQKRAAGKYHSPGRWANTCCTHPLWKEDSKSCALRRLEEELGITGLDVTKSDQVEYRANVGQGLIEHEVVDIFLADWTEQTSLALNLEEVEEVAWVELHELTGLTRENPERYSEWLKIYLEQHMDQIFAT